MFQTPDFLWREVLTEEYDTMQEYREILEDVLDHLEVFDNPDEVKALILASLETLNDKYENEKVVITAIRKQFIELILSE